MHAGMIPPSLNVKKCAQKCPKGILNVCAKFLMLQIILKIIDCCWMNQLPQDQARCSEIISLKQAEVGSELKINELSGPSCERLRQMGFCENLPIQKLKDGRNLLCSVCGTKLAVSQELAAQVMVTKVR